jgi:hypothetical protein
MTNRKKRWQAIPLPARRAIVESSRKSALEALPAPWTGDRVVETEDLGEFGMNPLLATARSSGATVGL